MSNHNEEKEAIEAALSRVAIYRGVPLCAPSITRVDDWQVEEDGSIIGPTYTVDCKPSEQVKALIDASLDATPLPVEPIPPIDPIDPTPPIEGSHTVNVVVTDGAGILWTASATVGNDATLAGQLVNLKNGNGDDHDGLQAMFYADCCRVSANRCDFPYDEEGCLMTVTYDGQPVKVPPSSYPDGTLTFWRGSRMPAIRYGEQVPFNAANIDWSVLPDFADEKQTPVGVKPHHDWSFNGVGSAYYKGMGTAGERGDIGFMSDIDMAFIANPSQETWELVRKTDDWSGNWRTAHPSDPITGKILNKVDYPNVTRLAAVQGIYPGNPIVPYGGTRRGGVVTPKASVWAISSCPHAPDVAHLTSYGMLTGMITKTAQDMDNMSFCAAYAMYETNPIYYRERGMTSYESRGTAWGLRSIFIAAFHSSDKEYFKAEVERNIDILNVYPVDEFGVYGTHDPYKGVAGVKGTALWMHTYLSIVVCTMGKKFPSIIPFATKLAQRDIIWFSKPYAFFRTVYSFMTVNADGTRIASFDERVRQSLLADNYTEEEANSMIAAKTVQEAYDIHKAHTTRRNINWTGKIVNGVADFKSSHTDNDSYPAGAIAAIYAAHNLGIKGLEKAVEYIDNLPTKIDYRSNQQNHIIKKD